MTLGAGIDSCTQAGGATKSQGLFSHREIERSSERFAATQPDMFYPASLSSARGEIIVALLTLACFMQGLARLLRSHVHNFPSVSRDRLDHEA